MTTIEKKVKNYLEMQVKAKAQKAIMDKEFAAIKAYAEKNAKKFTNNKLELNTGTLVYSNNPPKLVDENKKALSKKELADLIAVLPSEYLITKPVVKDINNSIQADKVLSNLMKKRGVQIEQGVRLNVKAG